MMNLISKYSLKQIIGAIIFCAGLTKTKENSGEAWDATKEGSGKAWDATKEGSEKAWDATKEAFTDSDTPEETPATGN